MTEEQPVPVDDTEEVKKAKEAGSEYLAVDPGEKNAVRVQVLNGPFAFLSYFDEKANRGFNFPKGTQLPGYDLKPKFVYEVLVLNGDAAGKHKILECGTQLAEHLMKVKADWNGYDKTDVKIYKEGSKKQTKWFGAALARTETPADQRVLKFVLANKVKWASKEDVEKHMSAPSQVKQGDPSLDVKISSEQYKLIGDLAHQKDIPEKSYMGMIERRFNKKSIDELTKGEASQLIDSLKNM